MGGRARSDGRRDRAPLRGARRRDRRAQRCATGRTRRRRQRGRRVRARVGRARGGTRRAAPAARPRHGRTACSSACGWQSTPARRNCATKATTSDPPSSAALACARSAPAGRYWYRARPPTSSATACRPTPRSPTSGQHRLKDLGRPERVFEVRHPEIPAGERATALARQPAEQPARAADELRRPRDRARRAARAAGRRPGCCR